MWPFYLCWAISGLCIVHLWLRPGVGVGKRLRWTAVLFIPLLGPLSYAGVFTPLPPHGERVPTFEDPTVPPIDVGDHNL